MSTTYLAIGPNCWGKASTVETAIANARKSWPSWIKGGRSAKNYTVYASDSPEIRVNDMGGICYPREAKVEEVQTSALKK